MIEKFEQLAGYEEQKIMVYGYPSFAWYPCIKINETVANYEEKNIMVGGKIPIQHGDNIVNMEI